MGKRWSWVMGVAVLAGLALGCSGQVEQMEDRKWLADRTDQFLTLYTMAYNKVHQLQGADHPCTSGHKAEEAALFHAVLQNLSQSYVAFQTDVRTRLAGRQDADPKSRELLDALDKMAKPFRRPEDLQLCGRLDAAQAKDRFTLQGVVGVRAVLDLFRTSIDL